jgi:hypothetical protein
MARKQWGGHYPYGSQYEYERFIDYLKRDMAAHDRLPPRDRASNRRGTDPHYSEAIIKTRRINRHRPLVPLFKGRRER